ncbi:hypothetical protein [Capsulimonas corticalis]|uniref:hypothetical protein n=1 Tax=Capsulimonas corticalis TaxID=2219043 RepID=UPI000F6461B7|nr:hypothetical protein [Capsulimonas corticalis]
MKSDPARSYRKSSIETAAPAKVTLLYQFENIRTLMNAMDDFIFSMKSSMAAIVGNRGVTMTFVP